MELDASDCVDAVLAWLDVPWSAHQAEQLNTYAEWLITEGVALGGIGPREAEKVWPRHLCDSLVFGKGLAPEARVLDVGSGVGLPGIPLAIAFPDASISALDRSGRRCDALNRVARHVGINIAIHHQDVSVWTLAVDRLLFRASLRVDRAIEEAERLLSDGGEAWFGLGRGPEPAARAAWHRRLDLQKPPGLEVSEVFVPHEVLDSGAWLLRIARA